MVQLQLVIVQVLLIKVMEVLYLVLQVQLQLVMKQVCGFKGLAQLQLVIMLVTAVKVLLR